MILWTLWGQPSFPMLELLCSCAELEYDRTERKSQHDQSHPALRRQHFKGTLFLESYTLYEYCEQMMRPRSTQLLQFVDDFMNGSWKVLINNKPYTRQMLQLDVPLKTFDDLGIAQRVDIKLQKTPDEHIVREKTTNRTNLFCVPFLCCATFNILILITQQLYRTNFVTLIFVFSWVFFIYFLLAIMNFLRLCQVIFELHCGYSD